MIAGSIEIQLMANIARLQSDMDKANRTVNRAMKGIEDSAKLAMRALGGLVGVIGIRELARTVDEYTKLTAQLKLATRSADEFSAAFSNVQRIARTAQSDISAVGVLYARLSNNLRDLGASQSQVSAISETVALSLRVAGATAQETSSVMLQLSQAFGAGRLNGQEFNAIAEGAPPLLRQLAKELRVTYGELKQMAADGKLTADVMARAWTSPEYLAGLRMQAQEVSTLGSAVTVLKNSWMVMAGEMNNLTGSGSAVGKIILFIADNMGFFGDAVMATIEVLAVLQKTALVAFHNIHESLKLVLMLSNPVTFVKNLEEIPRVFNELIEFNKAYAEDMKATFSGNFSQFRDALAKSRQEAAAPFDDTPLKAFSKSTDDATGSIKAMAAAIKDAEQAKSDYFDGLVKTWIEADKVLEDADTAAYQRSLETITAIEEQTSALQLEIDTYGMLPSVITDVKIAHLQQTKDAMKNFGMTTEAVDQQIAAYERLRAAQSGRESLEREKKANDKRESMAKDTAREIEREYDRMSRDISRSLTDALLRGFEAGKGFAENFKDTLINLFKTLILRPQIEMLVRSSGIAGVFGSGSAFASQGSAGGMGMGGIADLGKTVFDGLRGVQGSITGGIEQLGVMLANGNGGFLDSIGGFLGTNAGTIGNVLPFAGAAIQALSGDMKGAAWTAAGAAIGSVVPVIGTALGGVIGSVVGSFFGGKKVPRRGGAQGDASFMNGILNSSNGARAGNTFNESMGDPLEQASAAFAGTVGNVLKTFGLGGNITAQSSYTGRDGGSGYGTFVGNVAGRQTRIDNQYKDAFGEETFNQFLQQVTSDAIKRAILSSGIPDAFRALFKQVNGFEEINAMVQASAGLRSAQEQLADRFGITADQAAKAASATGKVGVELISFVNKLAGSALAFKSPAESILEAKDALIKGFQENTGTASTVATTSKVARTVTSYTGRTIGPWYAMVAEQTTKTYFDTITSYVTKLLPSTKALPTTLDEYDAVLKSINKSTAAGIEQFQKLFAMRDQFAQFTAAMDEIKGSVTGAVFGLKSPADQVAIMQADLAKLFGNLNLAVPTSVQELIKLGESIDYTTESGLDLALAFPALVQAFSNTRNGVDGLVSSLNALDPNRFSTLIDYRRAQAYVRNGISLDMLPAANMPSFDVGTNYVPSDMTAQIHQGERIIPAADNRELMNRLRSGDNTALVAEIRALRNEVTDLKRAATETEKNTKDMSRVLRNVTPNGDAIQTEAAA
jgi:tape measure domain-containing protein